MNEFYFVNRLKNCISALVVLYLEIKLLLLIALLIIVTFVSP
jgi:hypothetical protein